VNIRLLARKIWLKQMLLLFVIVAAVAWFNALYAKSMLIGGLIFLIPSIYSAVIAFRVSGNGSIELMLHNIYRGEFGKFLLTAAGFSSAFVLLKPFDVIVLFTSFCVMTVMNLVMLSRRELF
jgi:ATP synthase protein I